LIVCFETLCFSQGRKKKQQHLRAFFASRLVVSFLAGMGKVQQWQVL